MREFCAAGGIRHPFALFENNLSEPAGAILLEDLAQALVARNQGEFALLLTQLDEARAQGLWVALAANYEFGALLEPAFPSNSNPGPLLRAWVFRQKRALVGDALDDWWREKLGELNPQESDAGLLYLEPAWSEARHATASARILDYIREGDCYQVNLTFPMWGQAYGHPLAVFARLRDSQPVAHGALIFDAQAWILSRSPELFVSREGRQLICRPMKGTALRSPDSVEDQASAARLQASDKDRAENLMIVDLIRNDLGRLAPHGGVRVERLFELEAYRTIYQLTSTVSAGPVELGLSAILTALFPCGSVTGAPKIRAMQIIHELEEGPRGLYCGALGWLAPEGDFSFNVPIRTLQLDSAGQCRLDVGSGIVADSDSAAEYRECLAKAGFLLSLGASLQLIETLRRDADGCYPRLAGHLARLQHSSSELGFVCKPEYILQALQALSDSLPASPQRVRLALSREGEVELQSGALEPQHSEASFKLANWALDPADPRLKHKTTARSFYDAALHEAIGQGHFDVVFCNTRGELCEGARSNLFLEINGEMLTPALTCGLLPGVLRASLLASGEAREAILYPADLARAHRIWLGNALRGLVEVYQAC
jgi:para-aminobenzoate synthetase/4-amino-4-deoxychorismate lyase